MISGAELAPQYRREYLLSGDATATFVSRSTGVRFTFRVRQSTPPKFELGCEGPQPHFVSVLDGPENTSDYSYLGTIFDGRTFRHGARSYIAPNAPSAKAFAWCWAHLDDDKSLEFAVYHLGHCGRCGRPLTTPESIERGLGPVCAEKSA